MPKDVRICSNQNEFKHLIKKWFLWSSNDEHFISKSNQGSSHSYVVICWYVCVWNRSTQRKTPQILEEISNSTKEAQDDPFFSVLNRGLVWSGNFADFPSFPSRCHHCTSSDVISNSPRTLLRLSCLDYLHGPNIHL